MKFLKIFAVFVIFLLVARKISETEPPEFTKLVFFDDFHGIKLNENLWNINQDHRHEAQNCKESIQINNGLKIHTFIKKGKIYSGIIDTEGKFEMKNHETLEICAKLNPENGEWADCWLWSADDANDNQDPYNKGLEIDIFESRSRDKNNRDISNLVNQCFHWNGYGKYHECIAIDTSNRFKLNQGFHTYKLIWDDNYTFLIDDVPTWKAYAPPTRHPLFIVLSCECGFIPFWTQHLPKNVDNIAIEVKCIKVFSNGNR